jgi:chromate reductase, NAD(P)H dehydrogenase (quinone)
MSWPAFVNVQIMSTDTVRILAMSGSLRTASTNTALLEAALQLKPAGTAITLWRGSAQLPHFTPDLDCDIPAAVHELRLLVGQCDGIIIACPEYVRSIPGSFKNVLDWLVGGETFISKKIALWNASPRATHAQNALRIVLETMSGIIVEDACMKLPLVGTSMTCHEIANELTFAGKIATSLELFANELRNDKMSQIGNVEN